MNKQAIIISVLGGIGLGILLGSEYPGTNTTLLGAFFVILSLISMGILRYTDR